MSAFTILGKEKLKEAINNATFIKDVFENVKINPYSGSGNYESFYKAVELFSLQNELKLLKERSSLRRKENLKKHKEEDLSKYLCKDSHKKTKDIKKFIIKKNLLEYKCAECGIFNEYNGKPIILQLDHINGVNNDNRLENLRFLCPNCHSQTETWGGRNINLEKRRTNQLNKINKEKKISEQKKQLFEQRKKDVYSQDLTKYGWVTNLANIWKISRTQTRRWIKENLPDVPLFESTSKNITPQILEQRKKEKEQKRKEKEEKFNERKKLIENCSIDFSKQGWQTELAKLLNLHRKTATEFFYKFFEKKYPNIYKRH